MDIERRDFLKAMGGVAAAMAGTGAASANVEGSSEVDVGLGFVKKADVITNEQILDVLEYIADASDRDVEISQPGTSNQGRPIWEAIVGTGDTSVIVHAEQHADEVLITEGVLAGLYHLALNDGERIDRILENVTLHLFPRLNPDGHVQRTRVNHDPDAPEDDSDADIDEDGTGVFTVEGQGWDSNRYHFFDWEESPLYENFPEEYPENPVPETQLLIDRSKEIDNEWILDFHNKESPLTEYPENESVSASTFWPIAEGVPDEAQELSQQMCVAIHEHLEDVMDDDVVHVSQYPGGTYRGIGRNGHGLAGRGSVLFENAGGTLGDAEYRSRQIFEAMMIVLARTGDGSLYEIDRERAEREIPSDWDFDDYVRM
jgi:hypothetical protein